MKRLKSTLPNMILSLGLISILSGGLIGMMYNITKEPIDKVMADSQTEAIAQVLPPYDNNPEAEADTVGIDGMSYIIYPAKVNGKLAGAAVKGTTMDGFSGEVTLICGFDTKGDITDYRVLSHAETPGLGAKMEDWFRNPAGARSVLGKSPGKMDFRPAKDDGDIDGITAATISSRAFLGILRNAYNVYESYKNETALEADATSGASQSHHR